MTSVHAIVENVSRRGFLKGVLATGGLVVAAKFVPARAAFAAYATGADKMPHGVRSDPHLFVSIAPDGIVTIVAIRSEMGTGSRSEEHTSELQSRPHLVCRLLLEKKKK